MIPFTLEECLLLKKMVSREVGRLELLYGSDRDHSLDEIEKKLDEQINLNKSEKKWRKNINSVTELADYFGEHREI